MSCNPTAQLTPAAPCPTPPGWIPHHRRPHRRRCGAPTANRTTPAPHHHHHHHLQTAASGAATPQSGRGAAASVRTAAALPHSAQFPPRPLHRSSNDLRCYERPSLVRSGCGATRRGPAALLARAAAGAERREQAARCGALHRQESPDAGGGGTTDAASAAAAAAAAAAGPSHRGAAGAPTPSSSQRSGGTTGAAPRRPPAEQQVRTRRGPTDPTRRPAGRSSLRPDGALDRGQASAARAGPTTGGVDGRLDYRGGGGGHHDPRVAPASFLVRNVRSWSEAEQLLDVAGGPEGRPPPRQQLDLLLQSRRFRDHSTAGGRGGGGGGDDAAAGGAAGFGDWGLEADVGAAAGGRGSGAVRSPAAAAAAVAPAAAGADDDDGALWVDFDEAADFAVPVGEAVSAAQPPPLSSSSRGGGWAAQSRGSPPATGAAEDARWQADWELEWEVQVQRHARWLVEPPPPSLTRPSEGAGPGRRPERERELRPTAEAEAEARTAAAVMLPGHAAAAEAAASGPSGRRYSVSSTAAAEAAGLTRFSPIPPMAPPAGRAAPPGLLYAGRAAAAAEATASELSGGRLGPQSATPHLSRQQQQEQEQWRPFTGEARMGARAMERPAAAPRRGAGGGGLASIAGDRTDGAALAAEVLLRVVNDAAIVQPEAWTSDEVAVLLRRATKLTYRYPGLLPATAGGGQKQPPAAAAAAAAPSPQPSYKRNSAVGILPPSVARGATTRPGTRVPNADYGVAAGMGSGGVIGSQLRVRLQQLLLRIDGMLTVQPPGAQGPSAELGRDADAVSAGGARSPAGAAATAAAAAAATLSASAAAAAVWAAAALRLRLSPEGDVRQRLLEELRPRPRWRRLARGGARLLRRRRGPSRTQPQPQRRGPPPLGAGEVADVLWGFAVLGLQMSRPQLNRALRAVSDPRPTRTLFLLRPTCNARTARTSTRSSSTSTSRSLPPPTGAATASPAPRPAAAAAVGGGQLRGATTATTTGSAAEAEVELAEGRGGVSGGGAWGGHGGRWPRVSERGLAGLRPSQLTAVAWAAVQLSEAAGRQEEEEEGGVTRVWAARLFAGTQTRLSRLSPSQLVDLMWSVGRGRRLPTGPWRRAMAAALLAAAPRLVPWQVARAAAAFAKLRVPVPYNLSAALLSALHRCLTASQPSDVAALVWALPYITYPYTQLYVRRHRRLLLDLAIATQPSLPSLEPPQLVQLADGFARLGQLPGAEWMRLHREACIRLKPRFSESNRRKIRQAYAVMLGL
ncbi:hypothetical protein PLESTB_001574800 [Pleodorina starrii]|uniref:Uncharacterized protein n=1 Tax=Pleodorina starrii TaxID=330485 RepID=A0A9W6BXW3_9CHLO|nr:hypothetical protein PLESTM_000880200 [Pleodorina starrii]GLC60108.1 hypothetical protein PLESTB_001574800 [Pleodorina starrii]GLC68992.1 hypothetical protein PLESTF_000767200 [Pleodorina starrii]